MEIVLLIVSCFFLVGFTFAVLGGLFLGFLLGLWYAVSYYDSAERTGIRRWPWLQNCRVWNFVRTYFHIKLDFSALEGNTFSDGRGYLFPARPHGLCCLSIIFGISANVGTLPSSHLPKVPFIGASSWVFRTPFFRDLILWGGGIDVKRETLKAKLQEKESVFILPGGVDEMTLSSRTSLEFSFKHDGFLRLVKEADALLVPVFCKGENRIFATWNILRALRLRFTKLFGYPLPTFFFGPYPEPLTIQFGAPIDPRDHESIGSLKEAYWKAMFELIGEKEMLGPETRAYKEKI